MSARGERPAGGVSSGIVSAGDNLPIRNQWHRYADVHATVGTCRSCNGALVPIPPGEHDAEGEDGEVTWYEMRCLGCGRETAAPNGRVLRKSSLRSEQPSGWWAAREALDKEQARQRQGGPS